MLRWIGVVRGGHLSTESEPNKFVKRRHHALLSVSSYNNNRGYFTVLHITIMYH